MPPAPRASRSSVAPSRVRVKMIERGVGLDQRGDGLHLVAEAADDHHVVGHGGDRAGVGVELVQLRVAQVGAHQAVDVAVERRREQHPLAAGGGLAHQRVDGRVEAEVAQVVGLVEDGDLDVVGAAVALVEQVLQAARGGHHDVGAGAQLLDLPVVRRTAVDGRQLEVRCEGERLERAAHLGGQLAGRHHDQRARLLGAAARAGQTGQDRQPEGERLARAGLGAAEHVVAGHGVGDDGGLHGGGVGDGDLRRGRRRPAAAGRGRRRRARRAGWSGWSGRPGTSRRCSKRGGGRDLTRTTRCGTASLQDAMRSSSPITGPAPVGRRTHTGRQRRPGSSTPLGLG